MSSMNNIDEMKTPVENKVNNITIRLYPNPATDFFQLSGIEDTAVVTISDLHCRVLFTKQITGDEKISLSSLPKGVFIAKIRTSTLTVEKKLEKRSAI